MEEVEVVSPEPWLQVGWPQPPGMWELEVVEVVGFLELWVLV